MWETREFVLSAFQQYLRNQNMFAIWHRQADQLEPMFSPIVTIHPKATMAENSESSLASVVGTGGHVWSLQLLNRLRKGRKWSTDPWELVSSERLIANTRLIA